MDSFHVKVSFMAKYTQVAIVALMLGISLGWGSRVQAALQTFEDKEAFLSATSAANVTGELPDLGLVLSSATIGNGVTFVADRFAIGFGSSGGDSQLIGDWTMRLPGPDLAISDGINGSVTEDLDIVFPAGPVFAAGFDFVEPENDPNVNAPFVDSTFSVTLKAGTEIVGEFTFNVPNDVAAFVGVWSDVAFDRLEIRETVGDQENEFFGQVYTGTLALPCQDNVCQVDNQAVFLAATAASAATGEDDNGNPLPLPDLGDVQGAVTIGEVTLRSPQLFVGTGGDPRVVNGDWTTLLSGPDIALVGPGPVKRLDMRFAQPVYAAGFEYVEPQNGPNVGRRFSEATFTLELKDGNRTIRELTFNGVNDVPTFVGVWSDQAFTRMTVRSHGALGNKFFGPIYISFVSLFSHRGNILVVDAVAGTANKGALFEVNRVSGSREVLNDFGDGRQGIPGLQPVRVEVEKSGQILVVDSSAGTNFRGALFRVNPTTQIRTVVSDFGNPGQGPLGETPFGVAVEANGNILVVDQGAATIGIRGALFRINPGPGANTGTRTLLGDFGQGQNQGSSPTGIAVEANGNILVVDSSAGTNFRGALFRVNRSNGSRTLLSDFDNSGQGPLGVDPYGVAVEASGNILVVDSSAGTNFRGALFRVNPTTGFRTLLNDFGSSLQGSTLGGSPGDVAVEASGNILVVDSSAETNFRGALFRVNPITGFRTLLSDFGDPTLGPLGRSLFGVAVRR